MALRYEDQYALATVQTDFRQRICAACFNAAVVQLTTPPVTGDNATAINLQRMTLANAIVKDPKYALDTFAWVIVSRNQFNSREDISDGAMETVILAAFDAVARQIIPLPNTS